MQKYGIEHQFRNLIDLFLESFHVTRNLCNSWGWFRIRINSIWLAPGLDIHESKVVGVSVVTLTRAWLASFHDSVDYVYLYSYMERLAMGLAPLNRTLFVCEPHITMSFHGRNVVKLSLLIALLHLCRTHFGSPFSHIQYRVYIFVYVQTNRTDQSGLIELRFVALRMTAEAVSRLRRWLAWWWLHDMEPSIRSLVSYLPLFLSHARPLSLSQLLCVTVWFG